MTMGKLLKHAVRWHCTFIAAAFVVTGALSSAWGGRIDPELLQSINSAAPTDEFMVVVKLADKVDFQSMKASLAKDVRTVRHARIVQALRDKAMVSQKGIKVELDKKEREGRVKKV